MHGWFAGEAGESCQSACSQRGLVCSTLSMKRRLKDVRTSKKTLKIIRQNGFDYDLSDCVLGHENESISPMFSENTCFLGSASRTVDQLSCESASGTPNDGYHRLCYCQEGQVKYRRLKRECSNYNNDHYHCTDLDTKDDCAKAAKHFGVPGADFSRDGQIHDDNYLPTKCFMNRQKNQIEWNERSTVKEGDANVDKLCKCWGN